MTPERENWSEENATFFFDYRLLVPDEESLATWQDTFPSQWRALAGLQPCALQRRRVDVCAASHQPGEWVFLHVAKTVWLLFWESVELRNSDIESCHPLCAYVKDAQKRVAEID